MIDTAWSICSWDTSLPPSTTGSRMIWVPPSRSRASFGAQLVPAVSAPTRFRPRRTTMIAPSQARERQAFRTGLGDFAKGRTQLSRGTGGIEAARRRRKRRFRLLVDVLAEARGRARVARLVDATLAVGGRAG